MTILFCCFSQCWVEKLNNHTQRASLNLSTNIPAFTNHLNKPVANKVFSYPDQWCHSLTTWKQTTKIGGISWSFLFSNLLYGWFGYSSLLFAIFLFFPRSLSVSLASIYHPDLALPVQEWKTYAKIGFVSKHFWNWRGQACKKFPMRTFRDFNW